MRKTRQLRKTRTRRISPLTFNVGRDTEYRDKMNQVDDKINNMIIKRQLGSSVFV